jgi:hypothetical protein
VPFARAAAVLRSNVRLTIAPGGLVEALHGVGQRTVAAVRQGRVVAPDETHA